MSEKRAPRHFVHDDGRECWKQGGRWYFRTTSDELAKVTDAKPFVDGCERSHDGESSERR